MFIINERVYQTVVSMPTFSKTHIDIDVNFVISYNSSHHNVEGVGVV